MYDFTHTIRDEILGIEITYLDCEVDADAELIHGEPVIYVYGVYVDGKNLFEGTDRSKSLAADIAATFQEDDYYAGLVIENSDIVYRGSGGNDPDGHYAQVAS